MRAYWAMLLAGFRRQATYRLAAVSGLATNAFFGVVRTWAGAQVVRAEGHRRWIRFAREGISAAQLVALVLADHQVLDLSIVEPDIEDVIRRIYRGETRPPGAVPPP